MNKVLYFTIAAVSLLACTPKQDPNAFYLPAEWEPQEAVWLGWEAEDSSDDSVQHFTAKIIQQLQQHVDVVLWVTHDSLVTPVRNFLAEQKVALANVEVLSVAGDYMFWTRDSGPAFTINHRGERRAVDFNHTGYFRYLKRLTDVGADSAAVHAQQQETIRMMKNDSLTASLKDESILKSWMFVEGGAYEVNGKGTLLVSENFMFNNLPPHVRDTLSKKHLEEEFKRTLGITHVIWLGAGIAEDGGWGTFFGNYMPGGTNGHADEFARFANATTILLAWVDEEEKDDNPIKQATYARMKNNYEILSRAKDQDGNPFTIIKVPMPEQITMERVLTSDFLAKWNRRKYFEQHGFKEGDTLQLVAATSYLNFLISNNTLLLSSYTGHGTSAEKEARVKKIFQEVFPKHELVYFDTKAINVMGGGIHCITRQVPRTVKTE